MNRNSLKIVLGAALALGISLIIVFFAVTDEPSLEEEMGVAPSVSGIRYTIESPVYLYFLDGKQGFLSPEERLIVHTENSVEFARTIIHWLIRGPSRELSPTLPSETRLNTLFIYDQTAFVDFSREISDNHPGGVHTEHLTLVSIANSLILNIPDIKRVKILIEGLERDTLAGHIDMTRPFSANMLLVR